MSMIRRAITGAAFGLAALTLSACAATDADGNATGLTQSTAFYTAYQKLVQENYTGARDGFLAIVGDEPDNAYAHLNLGVAYEELGEADLAKAHYQIALDTDPDAQIIEEVEDGEVRSDVNTTVGELATKNLDAMGG